MQTVEKGPCGAARPQASINASRRLRLALSLPALVIALLALAACAAQPAFTPTPTRVHKPTQTPVPLATIVLNLPAATPVISMPAPAPAVPSAPPSQPPAASPGPTPLPVPSPAISTTSTAAPDAELSINEDTANARSGPGTGFDIVGTLQQGQTYKVVGKTAAGDWWEVCCVSQQNAWVSAALAQVTNAQLVAVAADIPAAAPIPTSAPPAPATQPPATAAPAAPAADPCTGLPCIWKVTGGPQMADNGGQELKMQLLFIDSAVGGGQPQGSYFVVLIKDGQKLPVSDKTRSIPLDTSQGTLGKYNYEYVLQLAQLPGNSVDGSYTIWVLDGNGNRGSENVNFSISGTQGLLWIRFDQA